MANEVTDRITVGVPWSEEAGSGGGIQEVNGYTGPSVQLDASDVGALPASQFASTSQRGSIQLATQAQALAGANSQNAMTPAMVRATLVDRHERSATSVAALGAGHFLGETALLILPDLRFLVFWSGLAWRSVSMSLAGTMPQRDAVTIQGLAIEGLRWRDIDTGIDYTYAAGEWQQPILRAEMPYLAPYSQYSDGYPPGVVFVKNGPTVSFHGGVSISGSVNITLDNPICELPDWGVPSFIQNVGMYQGSGSAVWNLDASPNLGGLLRAARYRPDSTSGNIWMPFSGTYTVL